MDAFMLGLSAAVWLVQFLAGVAVVVVIVVVLYAVFYEFWGLVDELAARARARRRDSSADTVARPLADYESTGNRLS